jgi:hypothetical protein
VMIALLAGFLIYDTRNDRSRLMPLVGLAFFLSILFLFSTNPAKVNSFISTRFQSSDLVGRTIVFLDNIWKLENSSSFQLNYLSNVQFRLHSFKLKQIIGEISYVDSTVHFKRNRNFKWIAT